jgi:hypothetical protein
MSIEKTLERFDSFIGAELVSVHIPSPKDIELTFHVQDKARDYDWIKVTFLFKEVEDAKLVDESQLKFLPLEEGISLLKTQERYGFGIGQYKNINNIKDSLLFIVAKLMFIEENSI